MNGRVELKEWQGWIGRMVGLNWKNGRAGQEEWQGWIGRMVGLDRKNSRVGQGEWQGWIGIMEGLEMKNGRVGQDWVFYGMVVRRLKVEQAVLQKLRMALIQNSCKM